MGHNRSIAIIAVLLSMAMLVAIAPSGATASGGEWKTHDTGTIDRLVSGYGKLPDGRIFVAAGADVSTVWLTNETWIYDPQAKSWEQVADCPYKVESSCSVAMPDGNVYLFGGMDGPLLERTLIYHVANDSWSEGTELPTLLMISKAAALDDHRVLIAGGSTSSMFSDTTVRCWIYDTGTETFTAAADMPDERACGMLAVHGSTAYYFGGLDADMLAQDDIFAYDVAANEWSTIGALPENLLNAAVVSSGHGSIFLIGGEGSFNWYATGSSKAYAFDTFTSEITALPDLLSPVLNAVAFMLDDGRLMYLMGNSGSEGNTDVRTLQTGEAKATLSATDVDQGSSVWLHVWVETEEIVGSISGNAYLVMDNVTYGTCYFSSTVGADVMVEIAISENLPAGEYRLEIPDLSAEGWWLERHFAPFILTVTDVPSTQERLDGLEAQNQAMQDKLNYLEVQNSQLKMDLDAAKADLQEAIDAKLDAMIGYAILILVIVTLVVAVLLLVRKK